MAQFPAMPLWTDAYLGDTTHLTTIEHGAYLLLLMAMWRAEGHKLPNDMKMLARYARMTPGQFQRIWPVLKPFFRCASDSITQGRLTDEAVAVERNSKKQSDKAKARWLKNKESGDAVAKPDDMPEPMPDECRDDASLTLTHSSDTNVSGHSADPDLDWLFADGLTWMLSRGGQTEKSARSVIGQWLKSHPPGRVKGAVQTAQVSARGNPVGYIGKVLADAEDLTVRPEFLRRDAEVDAAIERAMAQ